MAEDRWLPLHGAYNARDLGGLPLHSGGSTVPGRLFRSDTLQELTEDDVALLRSYPVGVVVDLRTPLEAHREGRGLLGGEPVDYVNLPFVPDSVIIPDDPRHEVVVADRYLKDRVEHYLDYLRLAGRRVLAALEVLAEPREGAVLFHCAAGKDRTGVLAALTLEVAGVDRDAIVHDYELTNERLHRIGERLARLATYGGYVAKVGEIRPQDLGANPATMQAFLERLDADHGGAAGWIRSTGGSEQLVNKLHKRLTD
ncbi:MAG TPA: tyrosine-protein phosphatase [Frankiaceae bacterium]|nr:tyrosine-protein phosphatase [Frankiaceae bacterium]